MKLLAISPNETEILTINGLTSIGGAKCHGIALPSLKSKSDYAVVSIQKENLSIVPLVGKQSGTFLLKALDRFKVDDLILIPLPESALAATTPFTTPWLSPLSDLMTTVYQEKDIEKSLNQILAFLIEQLEMEKGFFVSRTLEGEFNIVCHQGIDLDDPWLSEGFLNEVLSKQQQIFLQNVIGSAFEASRSLMATKFLSLLASPLRTGETCLGALVVGSTKPHAEMSNEQLAISRILIPIASQLVSRCLEEQRVQQQLEMLRSFRGQNDAPFITSSPELLTTIEIGRRVSTSDLSVYVYGETGVGKEVMARWIHNQSAVKNGPFIAVNCGAIPENLLESTLFGHKKGAFTGAVQDQIGKFRAAHGGTLFLDEIGDLPLSLQVKLLRVLQEREIEPLGATRPTPVDVRVICASHKNIQKLIQQGQFREDLFFRLNEVCLVIPPLRERRMDIDLIVSQFLKEDGSAKKLSPAAREWLRGRDWPGNVRELLSSLKRALLLATGKEVGAADFHLGIHQRGTDSWLEGGSLDEACRRFTSEKVKQALQLTSGNRTKAAELLGITSRTLFRYLENSRDLEGL